MFVIKLEISVGSEDISEAANFIKDTARQIQNNQTWSALSPKVSVREIIKED